MGRNNMFPFNSISSFFVLFGNVTTGRKVRFLTLEGTTTVESNRMILVDLEK